MAKQKEGCCDEVERNCDSKKESGQNRQQPFPTRFTFGCRSVRLALRKSSNERENSSNHRQNHETVEVCSAGETVGDKRIPSIPSRSAIAIFATNQSQEQRRHH